MRIQQSGSQGKGKRRVPWRDGGTYKQKQPEWRKQAMHAVDSLSDLDEPTATVPYRGRFQEKPAHSIYRLDQQLAPIGIHYHAEYRGRRLGFTVSVAAQHQETIRQIIAKLESEE